MAALRIDRYGPGYALDNHAAKVARPALGRQVSGQLVDPNRDIYFNVPKLGTMRSLDKLSNDVLASRKNSRAMCRAIARARLGDAPRGGSHATGEQAPSAPRPRLLQCLRLWFALLRGQDSFERVVDRCLTNYRLGQDLLPSRGCRRIGRRALHRCEVLFAPGQHRRPVGGLRQCLLPRDPQPRQDIVGRTRPKHPQLSEKSK